MDRITDDDAWEQLKTLDSHSGGAWTNEDPTLAQVLAWIDSQPDLVSGPGRSGGDEMRWRIENPNEPEKSCPYDEKNAGVKVCVSIFPAKL